MSEREPEHPFRSSRDRYVKYAGEYRSFIDRYRPTFDEFAATDRRFLEIDRVQPAFVRAYELEKGDGTVLKNGPPPTLQFQFGTVPLGLQRYATNGELATETGATLLYSFGPTGAVAVMLYPAKGNLGTTIESSILLRIGYFDSKQLLSMLGSDLRHWVDYAHVSALDGNPTGRERRRIWSLRLRQILYVDNKPQPAVISEKLKKLGSAAATGSLSGILRVAGGAVAGFVIGLLIG